MPFESHSRERRLSYAFLTFLLALWLAACADLPSNSPATSGATKNIPATAVVIPPSQLPAMPTTPPGYSIPEPKIVDKALFDQTFVEKYLRTRFRVYYVPPDGTPNQLLGHGFVLKSAVASRQHAACTVQHVLENLPRGLKGRIVLSNSIQFDLVRNQWLLFDPINGPADPKLPDLTDVPEGVVCTPLSSGNISGIAILEKRTKPLQPGDIARLITKSRKHIELTYLTTHLGEARFYISQAQTGAIDQAELKGTSGSPIVDEEYKAIGGAWGTEENPTKGLRFMVALPVTQV